MDEEDGNNATPLALASQSWMSMTPSPQNNSHEQSLEETMNMIMGCQPRLTEKLFYKVFNMALERNSEKTLDCIKRYVRLGSDSKNSSERHH